MIVTTRGIRLSLLLALLSLTSTAVAVDVSATQYKESTKKQGDAVSSRQESYLRKKSTSSNTNYCGRSWSDANAKCGTACPSGVNSECPAGEQCFGGTSCGGNPAPTAPGPAPGPAPTGTTNYCGRSWSDANTKCGTACPSGVNNECPSGEQCFGGITSCGGNPAANPLIALTLE